MKPHILIADDDPKIPVALKLLLQSEGMETTGVTTPGELLRNVENEQFDVVLMDLNYTMNTTSGQEGLDLLPKLRNLQESLPIVVMTGYGAVDIAVKALKAGAADFIQKPWDNDHLLNLLATQVRLSRGESGRRRLAQENRVLRDQLSSVPASGVIARSEAMKQLLSSVEHLSRSDMNLLLTGENGTGKSLLAEYIHRFSSRSEKPFLAVNMGAIPESLFESEMFGHVRGAFTDARKDRMGRFELARGGTLFLDEVACVPLAQQAKLLRVLEERRFEKVGGSKTLVADVRLISATNADLQSKIDEGAFRQDLLYRIKTAEIRIPPLRERVADIAPLAAFFLQKHAARYRVALPELSQSAVNMLQGYSWPGNVRELGHLMERALFLQKEGVIGQEHLGLADGAPSADAQNADLLENPNLTLDDVEKQLIEKRLRHFHGCAVETARSLGLSRSAFYRRLSKYGL